MLDVAEWSTQQWGLVSTWHPALERTGGSDWCADGGPSDRLAARTDEISCHVEGGVRLAHPSGGQSGGSVHNRNLTLQAAGERDVTLWVEDTTELDYSARPSMTGLLAQELTVAEFWRQVARLGGHQGRRSDGPPD